jgi:hypothetical protein
VVAPESPVQAASAGVIQSQPVAAAAAIPPSTPAGPGTERASFRDLLQALNPLNHIPGVRDVYRRIAGSPIGAAVRIAGGALMGGPIGAALAVVTTPVRAHSNPSAANPAALNPARSPGAPDEPAPAPPERRGGWIVAAAYATRDLARPPAAVEPSTVQSTAQAARQRPGGWLVNAAYANVAATAHEREPPARIDVAG